MVLEISFIKTCISKAPTDRISKKLEDILTELRMEKKKARAQKRAQERERKKLARTQQSAQRETLDDIRRNLGRSYYARDYSDRCHQPTDEEALALYWSEQK